MPMLRSPGFKVHLHQGAAVGPWKSLRLHEPRLLRMSMQGTRLHALQFSLNLIGRVLNYSNSLKISNLSTGVCFIKQDNTLPLLLYASFIFPIRMEVLQARTKLHAQHQNITPHRAAAQSDRMTDNTFDNERTIAM